jgi:hypothetical protein
MKVVASRWPTYSAIAKTMRPSASSEIARWLDPDRFPPGS